MYAVRRLGGLPTAMVVAALTVLAGCASADRRLDLVPRLLDADLTRRLMERGTHVSVRHQISQLADVWVVPLNQVDRQTLFQASGMSLEWLEPTRPGTAALIAIHASLEPFRSVRTDNGWQLQPTPDQLVRVDRPQLGEFELVVPSITPWSQVYLGWYSQPPSDGTLWLRKDGFSVRATLP